VKNDTKCTDWYAIKKQEYSIPSSPDPAANITTVRMTASWQRYNMTRAIPDLSTPPILSPNCVTLSIFGTARCPSHPANVYAKGMTSIGRTNGMHLPSSRVQNIGQGLLRATLQSVVSSSV
jgi:hypothetical protein